MPLFRLKTENYKPLSDEELAAKYRISGENGLLGELYARYGHLVLGLCLKYLRNGPEAEDALMHIFEKLIKDLRKHEISFFKSWLFVYSKNHCLMELRKRQVALKRELQLTDEYPAVMDFAMEIHLNEREEEILRLELAIETLNEAQKTCVRLFYLNSMSYAQIALKTGFNNNEVKSHIQNGKRNLKLKLETRKNEGAQDR